MSTTPNDRLQTPSLRAHLLGPMRISVSDRPIDDAAWPRRTARTLLLLLLATPGHALPRDRVLDLLWPEASPATALNALYVAVHGLRRVLEPDLASGRASGFVEFTSDQIRLRPDLSLWVDVDVFEQLLIGAASQEPVTRLISLREALSLYADELLVTEPYEDWPIARREQLRGAWRQAALEAADLELQRGHPLAAAQLLPALLTRDPTDEVVHYNLMRALASAGRGNDALRQYDRCVAVLRDELGMEPARETIELAAEIRSSSQSQSTTPVGVARVLRFEDIPAAPNPMIGRQREVESIQDLLLDSSIRLVTITGTAGIGKTRLAIEVANQLSGDFANGAVVVQLASLSDPALVLPALARALGMNERLESTTTGNLVTFLRPLELLLVLDNFEQILEASAGVAELLSGCPGLNVLVTSREPLQLRAEHVVTTPPLTVPPERSSWNLDSLEPELAGRYEAVVLFSQRARAICADFALTSQNVHEVADLCQRLEGVPLAIELAAAAIQDHSPAGMLAALDDRLSFLAARYRDLPARQRTMRDAISWSYDLLGERDRQVFNRLSVFVGGIHEDAARLVAETANHGAYEVVEAVQSLARKNLLQREMVGGESRYRMLESIREFGLEVLADSGEPADARGLHAVYFAALAERAASELTGPHQIEWFDRLDTEHDNMRAMLRWTLDNGSTELALRSSTALSRFWWTRGYFAEGRSWLKQALSAGEVSLEVRAAALSAAGLLAEHQSDLAPADMLHRQALALWRKIGDRRQIAGSYASLGNVAQDSGNYQQASEFHEVALALFREEHEPWGAARSLNNLGAVAYYQGNYERARDLWTEAQGLMRGLGDTRSECQLLNNLGALAYQSGELSEARAMHEQVLGLRRRLNDKQGIASSLVNLSEVARKEGEVVHTETLLQEAVLLAREIGDNRLTATALAHLGMVAQDRDDFEQATIWTHESIDLLHQTGDQLGLTSALVVMASLLIEQGQLHGAVRLLVAADGLREALGAAWEPVEQMTINDGLEQAREAVGAEVFATLWNESRAIAIEDTIAEVLASAPR